jgi:hypothetical protein
MESSFIRPWCAVLCALSLATPWVRGQITNSITGDVTENATWSDTWLLEGQTKILPEVEVRIKPGTRLLFKQDAVLEVQGTLLAEGEEGARIQFTREKVGVRWKQLRFVGANPSVLKNCVFEYADCAGTHLDYYDDDCDAATPLPPRDYHEAIVVIGCHVDLEDCLFQYLPTDNGSGEGDAIAVISDDPELPRAASAVIRRCRFLGIGQGIHTRFAHVRVEECFFTAHNGDNDDVDLYGESDPPPLILNNVFLDPNHDDMINPTQCSAIIVGNLISGSDDHGVVLRDQGSPILMNNLIVNCRSGGIAIQNQCDALIMNTTIMNCGRGIRFFDHTGRWGPPYCLAPGSGSATVVNSVIWDCSTSMLLTDSPSPENPGSNVSIRHSLIQGGFDGLSVSADSTVDWGEANLDVDPLLDLEQRPTGGSPVVDAGTDPRPLHIELDAWAALDLDGRARPLDGTDDGAPAWDLGAYEFLSRTADSNSDGIPDDWCEQRGFNPLDPTVAAGDPDQDKFDTHAEWVADTDPWDAQSKLTVRVTAWETRMVIECESSAGRVYSLWMQPRVNEDWSPVAGQQDVVGTDGPLELVDADLVPSAFYQVRARLP